MSATRKNSITFDVIKDSYIGTLKKYVVFTGRARRREFWIFFFCNLVLGIIPLVGFVVALLTFIPNITVGVRRFHDTNRSGFWLLLFILIPLVGSIILFAGGFAALVSGRSGGILWIFLALLFIISIAGVIILIVWAAQEGTRGKNKYGPDPKVTSGAVTSASKINTKAASKTRRVSKPRKK